MYELANLSLIRLRSPLTKKYLRIMKDGTVAANSGKGPEAVFQVHRVDANSLKLSSAEYTKYWLMADAEGNVSGFGNAGKDCVFVVKFDSFTNISLSPATNLDWHLGTTIDGSMLNCSQASSCKEGRWEIERVSSWPTNY